MYNETRTDLLNYLNNNKIEYTSVGNHTIQVNLTVTKEINSKTRTEVLFTIDELRQYLKGNVTTEALKDALEDCQLALDGHFINK
jgi:hypothetical protein